MKIEHSTLCLEDRLIIGHALYDAGFPLTYSSNVCDDLIAGYGILEYDFEYPVDLTRIKDKTK